MRLVQKQRERDVLAMPHSARQRAVVLYGRVSEGRSWKEEDRTGTIDMEPRARRLVREGLLHQPLDPRCKRRDGREDRGPY